MLLLESLAEETPVDDDLAGTIDRGRLIDLAVGLVETSEWQPLTGTLDEHLLDKAPAVPSTT